MSRLQWDQVSEKLFEVGVDHGVLFPLISTGNYGTGVVWNGLTAVNQSPEGGEEQAQYADNMKYISLYSAEEFKATIEAFTYPVEFEECDGSKELAPGVMVGQQNRKPFAFSWRTLIGNDTEGQEYGYKIHIAYGATAAPSEKSYETINDSPEAITFSWEVSTTPIAVPGMKPTAHLTIDSTKCNPYHLKKIEDMLYGTDDTESMLPMPADIIRILAEEPPKAPVITVADPGDASLGLGSKSAKDIQTGVTVTTTGKTGTITGTLLEVGKAWTEFSPSNPSLQKGYFLALKMSATENAEIEVQLIGGTDTKKLDATGIAVFHVGNKDVQSIRVHAKTSENMESEVVYSLAGLVLQPAPTPTITVAVATDPLGVGSKTASEIMSNVTLQGKAFKGELTNVSDAWTEFDTSNNTGHFLAIKATATANATVKVTTSGSGPVKQGGTGVYVIRVEANSEKVTVTATTDQDKTATETYDLSGLTLAEE